MKFYQLAFIAISLTLSVSAKAVTTSEVWWVDNAGNASLLSDATWTATDSGTYGNWAAYDN